MQTAYSEAQEALAASAKRLLQRECPVALVREAGTNGGRNLLRPALWRTIAEAGWTAVLSPESDSADPLVDACILLEELGAALAPVPFLESAILAPVILSALDDARELDAVFDGSRIVSVAIDDPDALRAHGCVATGIYTPAPSRIDAIELRASYPAIGWADGADEILCPVATTGRWLRDDAGVTIVRVPRGAFAHTFLPNLAEAPLFRVTVEGRQPATALAGPWNGAAAALARGRLLAAVGVAAQSVGVCRTLSERAIAYAKSRQQFGVPIGTFQAIQHRCVDMSAAVVAARVLVVQAAWKAGQDGPGEPEAALARSFAAEALRNCLHHAHQVHGAIGFSREHDLPLFTRWARILEARFGTAGDYRRIAAQHVIDRALSPDPDLSSCRI